jgi:hypothetical protein
MAQLELFPKATIAALRDWSKDRRRWPGRDDFRRDCARRRKWGLKRRHAEKLCRLNGCSRRCMEVGIHDPVERVPPLIWDAEVTCTERPAATDLPHGDEPRDGASRPNHQAGSMARAEPACPREKAARAAETAPDLPMVEDREVARAMLGNRAGPAVPADGVVSADGAVQTPGCGPGRAGGRRRGRCLSKGTGTARACESTDRHEFTTRG